MAEFSSWRPCSGCFHFRKRSLPTAGIKDRNLRKRLQKFFRISMLKSSNVPIGSKDLWFCPNAGSSSAPSLGSIAAEDSPRIGRTSTARRSRSCASPQSASCSENSVINAEVSGRTLERFPFRRTISRICEVYSAFRSRDLIKTRGDRLAEAPDGERGILQSICGHFAQERLEFGE